MSEDAQFPLTPKELMKRVATKGDLATVLLAAPVGFVGDIVLSLGGIVSPGTCAVLTASGALGLKNAAQAAFGQTRAASNAPDIVDNGDKSLKKAKRVLYTIREELGRESGLDLEVLAISESKLRQEITLYEDGISDIDILEASTHDSLSCYRHVVGLDDNSLTLPRMTPRRDIVV